MTEIGPIFGILGKLTITISFLFCALSMVFYFRAANRDDERFLKTGNWLFILKGVWMLVASGMLIFLIMQHQFQYYYVFNYTSLDLAPK